MARIGIEQPFTDVKEELSSLGFEAEMLQRKTDAPDYDCVVVRAMDDMADIHMNVPIIVAKGRTVRDIIEEVKVRLQRTGEMRDMGANKKAEKAKAGKQMMSGMAVGTVVGAAAGMLLAPKSGKELRENMTEKASQTKEQTRTMANKVKEKSSDAKATVTDITNKTKEKVKNRPSLTGRTRGVQESPAAVKDNLTKVEGREEVKQ